MKIRMLSAIAGDDFSLSPGDETERFSDKEARRMVAAGAAEEVKAGKGGNETTNQQRQNNETR